MSARDWTGLDWAPTLNFALPTERQLAQSSQADAGKGAEYKFNPTALNAQLLASLGYTGQGLANTGTDYGFGAGPQWSDDARTWLANNGYTVGVAHDPGTSPGGRPEYYGLVDPNGKFVAGQDDPTMTMSDSLMDQITPFLMLAGPFASAISTSQALAAAGAGAAGSGGAAAGAGAGAGAAGGSISSGLSGAADGVTALGASMSPEALGFTGAIAPGATSAEIAALSSGIPSLSPSITDLALQGAMRGAVTGGIKGLATGQNPFESALSGALGGGLTGGISGGVNALNPGGGWINSAITGGTTSALTGGNPLMGAVGGAAGSLANTGMSMLTQPTTTTTGANMNLGDWFSDWSPDSLNLTTDITGNVLPVDLPTFTDGGLWNPEYGNWVSDWATSLFGGGAGGGSDGPGSSGLGSAILNGLKGAIGSGSGAIGGGGNLAALIGAGLGAASGGGSQTKTNEPWQPAQQYLKDILGDAANMRANLAAQPYTPQQTEAYGNAYAGLDQARAALPGLLSWGQGAMQRQNTVPSYEQLFGGGLLGQSQTTQMSATALPGGPGGLLGDSDRMKALVARGQKAIG